MADVATLETVENKVGGEVSDNLFKAWMEGNSRWPQATFPGSLYLLSAFLEDPQSNLSNLESSHLSPAQIKKVGAVMTGQHKKHSVETEYEHTKDEKRIGSEFTKQISGSQLDDIWEDFKVSALDTIRGFIRETEIARMNQMDERQQSRMLDWYLKDFMDDRNSPNFIVLKSAIQTAIMVLESAEGKQLSEDFKATYPRGFDGGKSQSTRQQIKIQVAGMVEGSFVAKYPEDQKMANFAGFIRDRIRVR